MKKLNIKIPARFKIKFQQRKLVLNSKIVVGVCAAIMLVLGTILILQGFIDTKNYNNIIRQTIKEHTGKDITIRGKISIVLLPVPTIYVPGVELRDAPSEKPAPALSVDMISMKMSFGSIFSDDPRITSITLERPVLEVSRSHDNYVYWGWLNGALVKSLWAESSGKNSIALNIVQGRIMYIDKRTDKTMVFDDINTQSADLSSLVTTTQLTIMGQELRLVTDTNPVQSAARPLVGKAKPLHVRLDGGDKGSIELNGSVDYSGDEPEIKGELAVDVQDVMRWVKARAKMIEAEQAVFDKLQQKNVVVEEDDGAPLPLKIKASWDQQGTNIALEDFEMDGLNSNGKGTVTLGWEKWYPVVGGDFKFSGLDYNQWHRFLTGFFMNKASQQKKPSYGVTELPENPLPKDIQLTLTLNSEQLFVTSQIWKNLQLSAILSESSVTVNTLSVDLPGEANLMLFGIISQGSTGGLRFEGSMETAGSSLRQMLTVFDESAADLPETGFGDFFARANIFVSAEQIRLSEADVKLSDLRLNGGLVAYFDASPRLEADVKLKNINFDYFRDVWREKNRKSKKEKFFLHFDRGLKFNWLKKLQTNIDLKVGVDKFTFLERPGDSASFRIFVKPSEFGIYDMRFNYPYETLQASFNLNVNGEQPYINVVLNTNELNMDYFNLEPQFAEGERPSNTFKGIHGAIVPEDEMISVRTFMGIDGAIAPEDGIVGIANSFIGVPGAIAAPAAPLISNIPSVSPMKDKRLDIAPQSNMYAQLADMPDQAPAGAGAAAADTGDAISTDEKPKDQIKSRGTQEIIRDQTGVATSLWSSKLIDMSGFEGFNGSFDISVGRLIYNQFILERLKMQAKLDNNLITFQNLAFLYWQGRCSVLGSIYGGKVPGLSLSFTLFNLELADMIKDLTGRTNITGKASISGTVTTSGVNTLSWVSQSEAKLVIAARGVYVKGINLQGVVDTLMVSRTAADVFNNVNMALINGDTNFTVDGNINVKNGVMKTPGITLRTGNITGDLTGELKLVPWKMELSTLFQFPTITSETIPTMTVQNSGPVESTQIRTDTSSLEAYVAKRIISK